ncbi:MAG: lipopolysaccharide heptosyltransferase II [Vicinamibacterales bacterium]
MAATSPSHVLPATVLVVSPNWLGDAVMALPALADIRRAFPAARLVVAARRSVAGLFALVPGVDAVVPLDWRGRRGWSVFRQDRARLAAAGAGLAVLLPNSFASALLVWRAGVRERWGYRADWRAGLLSRGVPRPTERPLHQADYYQRLTAAVGIAPGPQQPVLQVPAAAVDEARRLLAASGWDGVRPLYVLAPGAAYGGAKRWELSSAAAVVAALVRDGATCVLVGSAADAPATRTVKQSAAAHVIDLAGATTIESLAGVCTLASACVSNDSGAMHLAAAVGVPLVALFGPTNERETSPLAASEGQVRILATTAACRPCMLRECPIDHRCMTGLSPAQVLETLGEVASSARDGARQGPTA